MAHKRFTLVATILASSLALAGCSSTGQDSADSSNSSDTADQTVEVQDNHGTQTVPVSPAAVVATDNRSFEILDQWGVDLVAAPKPIVPRTVDNYKNNEDIVDIGNHREPDLEALVAAQPDLIVNGQRFAQHYEDIRTLNPDAAIVDLEPRDGEPMDQELIRHTTALGEIFGKQDEAQRLVDDFQDALERAKQGYDGQSSVMGLNASGGEIGYVAPSKGRFWGPIFDWLQLKPSLTVDDATDSHTGDDISVEAIADSNPAWLLVLDRDGATSDADKPEYTPAQDVIAKNEALRNVTAVKDKQTLFAPADTYTNENIITYTEVLNNLADAFEKHSA